MKNITIEVLCQNVSISSVKDSNFLAAISFYVAKENPGKIANDGHFRRLKNIRLNYIMFGILMLLNIIKCQGNVNKVEYLNTFCKVWGLLKYSPINKHSKFTNDSLPKYINKILNVKNNIEFNAIIASLSEGYQMYPAKNSTKYCLQNQIASDILQSKIIDSTNSIKLHFVIRNFYNPKLGKRAKMYGLNSSNDDFTYARYDFYKESDVKYGFPLTENIRLAIIFRIWNIVQFFYPFRDEFKEDWDLILNEVISKELNIKNDLDFNVLLMEFMAKMHDSHGLLSSSVLEYQFWGWNKLPIKAIFNNKKLYISDIDSAFSIQYKIYCGDIICGIDGISIDTLYNKYIGYINGANKDFCASELIDNLLRSKKSSISIDIEDSNGNSRRIICNTMSLESYFSVFRNRNSQSPFSLIRKDVFYVNVKNISESEVNNAFKIANKCNTLIIDCRGYPKQKGTVEMMASRIVQKITKCHKYITFNPFSPGKYDTTTFLLFPNLFHRKYKGRIIVLMDETTISQAELNVITLFSASKNITSVGRLTAGATGGLAHTIFPQYIIAQYTLGKFIPIRNVPIIKGGIIPDYPVQVNVIDLRKNKDTILNYALTLIK